MGKYKLPTVQEFLQRKRLYSKKKDLEWEYIEKEMVENIDKKPYNETVHKWLQFLKELRHYYHAESKKQEKRLLREVGPSWYIELSIRQREVLAHLKSHIHQDLLENIPRRTKACLTGLGFTLKIPKKTLLKTMELSLEDPGLFIWFLYQAVYNKSPSELRPKYDVNAMILMSSLVFIDLDECVAKLEKLTYYKRPPTIKVEEKKPKYYEPKIRYGVYKQKMYVPLYTNQQVKEKQEPLPLGNKFRLRSDKSYENIIRDSSFIAKRIDRNKQENVQARVCNYKFWEPPSTLRNTDPKKAAYVNKLKMLRLKAKPKFKTPYKNVQYLISGVTYIGGKPNYILTNVSVLPSGYIAINAGIVNVCGTAITSIAGFWLYPTVVKEECDHTCDCMTKWEASVMDYLKKSKCKCGHNFDYYNEGKVTEKYYYPPTRDGPHFLDEAKIYSLDPMEDFIRDTFKEALKSRSSSSESSEPTISAQGLGESELLAALLADISDSALIIPHLPQACLLNNLQEWVRKRVKGPLTPREHKRMLLQSGRRWLNLKHMDHRARAYSIPFTMKEIHHINWSHRYMVQELFQILLDNFISRNRRKQIEQTRMWWPTTKYDCYPNKPFLEIFFTYLPSRPQDVHFINPYSSKLTPKYGAKTCPLRF